MVAMQTNFTDMEFMIAAMQESERTEATFVAIPSYPCCVFCGSSHTPESQIFQAYIVVEPVYHDLFPPRPEGVTRFGVALMACRACMMDDARKPEQMAWLGGLVSNQPRTIDFATEN